MRIAQKTIWETNRYQLGRITEEMTNASLEVSSGKRINSLKDDPVGVAQVLTIKSNLSELGQIERNISTGRNWLSAGETALTQVQDIIGDVTEIAVTMKSTTATADMRMTASKQIQEYLLQIKSLSNTKVQNQYLFAGTKTDTIPFTFDDENNTTIAAYNGNDGAFRVKTGKNAELEVGHDGEDIFRDLFSTLIDLKGSLEGNDPEGIGTSLNDLGADFDRITTKISEIGVKDVRLNTQERIIVDLNLRYKENRAEIEEVDVVEAISRLQATEFAYQAALASSARLMRTSLVDYL